MATELLKGKTIEQARAMSAEELSGDLGALPPMKIHCGQLVEGALRSALDGGTVETKPAVATLSDDMKQPAGKVKINFLSPS